MSRLLARKVPHTYRLFSTGVARPAFATGPAPPRLPAKEQEEFEKLQKLSTGAFSTPRPAVVVNQSSSPTPSKPQPSQSQNPIPTTTDNHQEGATSLSAEDAALASVNARVEATGTGEELHPHIRRGAKPEFEGDINPKTGEVGGPKNEPLRWGSTDRTGDWSYNGRVTDF